MGGNRRVLIVDDEQAVCQCLKEFFVARGFVVETAFSGEEALTRLRQAPVDAVLIDILLPGIHGLEVLRQAKALHPSARAIMMTGLTPDEMQAEAIKGGADGFVPKPLNLGDAGWSAIVDAFLAA